VHKLNKVIIGVHVITVKAVTIGVHVITVKAVSSIE
jgi:hypothetical protein